MLTCGFVTAIQYMSAGPALVLPFACRGGAGSVRVHYGVSADPVGVGFDLVAVGFDEELFRGFPAMRAEVSFDQDGYRAIFGWLQIISRTTAATGDVDVGVDLPPLLAGADWPLAGFGYLPTMFDAPANPDHPDGDWVAETFLVAVPDVGRTRQLAALTGFRWGYRLAAARPALLPASPVGPERWKAHQPMLAGAYQSWSFLDSRW